MVIFHSYVDVYQSVIISLPFNISLKLNDRSAPKLLGEDPRWPAKASRDLRLNSTETEEFWVCREKYLAQRSHFLASREKYGIAGYFSFLSKTNSREPSGHPAGFFLQTSPFLCTSILPHQNWTCADSPSIFHPKNLPTSPSACWHCNWPLQIFRLRSLEIEKTRPSESALCYSNFRMLSRCPSRRKNWVDGKGLNTWLLQTSHCDWKNDDNFNVCKWCLFRKVSVFWRLDEITATGKESGWKPTKPHFGEAATLAHSTNRPTLWAGLGSRTDHFGSNNLLIRVLLDSYWLVVSTPPGIWKSVKVRLDHHPNYWGK